MCHGNPVVVTHQCTGFTDLVITKAGGSTQADVTFLTLAFVVHVTEAVLQLLSSRWPMLVAPGFYEVYFCHSITAY
jgi:hypothetical protein